MLRAAKRCFSLALVLFVFGFSPGLHAQNFENVLGVEGAKGRAGVNAIVVKRSVETSGAESYNGIEVGKEIDKLLDEINKLIEDLSKIVDEGPSGPSLPGRPNSPARPATTPAQKPTASNNTAGGRTYTVVSGDTLWGIAQRFLGNGNRYWEIVQANKSRYTSLLNNPNLISPGWKFIIPGGRSLPTNPGNGNPPPTTNTTNTTGTSTSTGKTGESAALNAWKGGKLSPSEFARLLGPVARESMKRTGVPASVTLAQAALETGWGKATIGNAKNLFGMKGAGPAGSITVRTQEYMNGRYITTNGTFRKYNTWLESFNDHARLISQGSRYANSMRNKNNPDQFARELQKAGYATSPTYASTLISIMKSYNLYQWDK